MSYKKKKFSMSYKKKNKSFICHAASPLSPPGTGPRVRLVVRQGLTAIKAFVTHPFTITITAIYGGHLTRHIVPKFHQILLQEGPIPAASYAAGAVFKGRIDLDSNFGISIAHALKASLKLLPKEKHKFVFQEIAAVFGEQEVKKMKRQIGYRGGGPVYCPPDWFAIYTKLYLSFLFCFFCVLFIQSISEGFDEEPEIAKLFYESYLTTVVPYGFYENQKSFVLNSLFIYDEVYPLGVDIDF